MNQFKRTNTVRTLILNLMNLMSKIMLSRIKLDLSRTKKLEKSFLRGIRITLNNL